LGSTPTSPACTRTAKTTATCSACTYRRS
jgi:hypothetical protein